MRWNINRIWTVMCLLYVSCYYLEDLGHLQAVIYTSKFQRSCFEKELEFDSIWCFTNTSSFFAFETSLSRKENDCSKANYSKHSHTTVRQWQTPSPGSALCLVSDPFQPSSHSYRASLGNVQSQI